jgi:putative sterol carrier protein
MQIAENDGERLLKCAAEARTCAKSGDLELAKVCADILPRFCEQASKQFELAGEDFAQWRADASRIPAPTSAKEIFAAMPSRFNRNAAIGISAIYGFDLTGDGGGKWHVIIQNEQCLVRNGATGFSSVTIKMSAQDYVDMYTGKLDGNTAFMSGKMKIAGEMGLVLRMQSLLGGSDLKPPEVVQLPRLVSCDANGFNLVWEKRSGSIVPAPRNSGAKSAPHSIGPAPRIQHGRSLVNQRRASNSVVHGSDVCASEHETLDFGRSGYLEAYPRYDESSERIVIHYSGGDTMLVQQYCDLLEQEDSIICPRATMIVNPTWKACIPSGHVYNVIFIEGDGIATSQLIKITDPDTRRSLYVGFSNVGSSNRHWFAGPLTSVKAWLPTASIESFSNSHTVESDRPNLVSSTTGLVPYLASHMPNAPVEAPAPDPIEVMQQFDLNWSRQEPGGRTEVIQVDVSGNGGGSWYVLEYHAPLITPCIARKGTYTSPDTRLTMSADSYSEMVGDNIMKTGHITYLEICTQGKVIMSRSRRHTRLGGPLKTVNDFSKCEAGCGLSEMCATKLSYVMECLAKSTSGPNISGVTPADE